MIEEILHKANMYQKEIALGAVTLTLLAGIPKYYNIKKQRMQERKNEEIDASAPYKIEPRKYNTSLF